MSPKVSVVITSYNNQTYIEQCIMSVLLQKVNFPIEIIVGDDNSTDDSYKILNRLEKFYESDMIQFKIYKNNSNLGEIENIKLLIENSEGKYISHLDSDDYWIDPYKLSKQVDFLDQHEDHSLCVTGYLEENKNGFVPSSGGELWFCPIDEFRLNSKDLIDLNYVGSASSRVFRNYNDLFKDYFHEFPYSDWPLNFELSFHGKIKYLKFASFVRRNHDNSLSNSIDITSNIDNYRNILKQEYYNRI
jgi:glycosyltransferase involved in cell wall biosynthesis